VKFTVRPSILLNSIECSPLRLNEEVKIPSRGHPWGPGVKLRISLELLFRESDQALILRLLNLQLERKRCSGLERFSK
jgi:hypothetical protein